MMRTAWALLLGVSLATGAARAADKAPANKALAGNWKVTILAPQTGVTLGLVTFASKEGKWTGKVIDKASRFATAPITIDALKVTAEGISFTLRLGPQNSWSLQGKISANDPKAIRGSIEIPGRPEAGPPQMLPVRLDRTTDKKLDSFANLKTQLTKELNSYRSFDTLLELLQSPGVKKAKLEELKTLVDKVSANAEAYGPRWQRYLTLRLADVLSSQDSLAELAVDYAIKAEKLTGSSEGVSGQRRAIERVIAALRKAKKNEQVKQYEARLLKLEDKMYEEFVQKGLSFKTTAYKGRKSKNNRVVLVELFCSAQSAPSVAAELALLALGKRYKPSEVVLLQYHLQLPPPDVLSNPACKERLKYYFDEIEGTPAAFFSGKLDAAGGGSAYEAEEKYTQYSALLDPMLAKSTPVKLTLKADRKGDKIAITAEATGVEKPGSKVRLRLALVEAWVKYRGANRLPYQQHVVRDMPGGANGVALTKKAGKQSVTVDLKKLRKALNRYLENYAKVSPFPDEQRPLDLQNLAVVAFVQNDETKEVLQAVQVKVGGDGKAEKKGEDKEKEKSKEQEKKKEKEKE